MAIDPFEDQLDDRENEWFEPHGDPIEFVNISVEAQNFRVNLATHMWEEWHGTNH